MKMNLISYLRASILLGQILSIDAIEVPKDGTDGSALRKSENRKFQVVPLAKFDKNPSNELILSQQVDNVRKIHGSFESFMNQLHDVDLSMYPEFEGLQETAEYYQNETTKVVDDIIVFLEKLEAEQSAKDNEISTTSTKNQPSRNQNKKEYRDGSFDKKEYEYKRQQEKNRRYHRRAREQAEASGYGHFFELHDALEDGDHAYMERMMSSFTRDRTFDAGSSRFDNQGRRKLSKEDQCTQLKSCASKISLYDLFIFFYLSYIDKSTGEVNANADIVRFDERNLAQKLRTIRNLAGDDGSCDDLLSQFHQTIDNGGTPEWHGATVSQVCLVEGTTQYASLSGIMSTIADLTTFYQEETQTYLKEVIDNLVSEILGCSVDLFYSSANADTEKDFIFIDKDESDPRGKSLENARFPFAVDVSTYGCEFIKIPFNQMKDEVSADLTTQDDTPFDTCRSTCCENSWCQTFACYGSYTGRDGVNEGRKICEACRFYRNKPRGGPLQSTYDRDNQQDLKVHRGNEWFELYVSGSCDWKELTDGQWDVGSTYSELVYNIGTVEECQALAEANVDYLSFDYYVGRQRCYLSNYMFIESEVRRNSNYILKQCELGESPPIRRESGQLVGNAGTGYLFKNYMELKEIYTNCVQQMIDDETETIENARNCIKEFTEPIDDGLKLVFGSTPSPGFVCGIKNAVAPDPNHDTSGREMPGSCCLDAPFQLEGDNWGHGYTCSQECQQQAPFFASLSEDACHAYGGSYCPNVNCTALRDCIAEYKESGDPAYVKYLESAPSLNSTNDKDACYATREFFGYQGNYINDGEICNSVWQLRKTRDFDSLADFIGRSGDDGGEGQSDDLGGLVLREPKKEKSESEAFRGEEDWKELDHQLQEGINGLQLVYDIADSFECPEDLTGIVKSVCAALKNTILPIMNLAITAAQKIHDLSEYIREKVATLASGDLAEIWEASQEVYGNMKETGKYLTEKLNNYTNHPEFYATDEGEFAVAKHVEHMIQQSMENKELSVKQELVDFQYSQKQDMVDFQNTLKQDMANFKDSLKQEMTEYMSEINKKMMQIMQIVGENKESDIK